MRVARVARAALSGPRREKMGVFFRERSIFIRVSITFSFAQDTVLLPCITDLRQRFIFLKGNSGQTIFYPLTGPKVNKTASSPQGKGEEYSKKKMLNLGGVYPKWI